jgi:hypothetical protein
VIPVGNNIKIELKKIRKNPSTKDENLHLAYILIAL